MWYGDKRDAKVNIAMALVEKGWKIYGYKNDESDGMTDYYSPADWNGIAEKNGYVLCIDQNSLHYSGLERKEYIGGSATYKSNARIQKLEAMMNDEASTDNEKASCAVLIKKEREKDGAIEKYKVIETYPKFSHPNPKSCSWHIEKDGEIVGKGTGVFACYQSNDHIKENRIERDIKINKLIARFEKVLSDTDSLVAEVIQVPVTVTKLVEKNIVSLAESDIKDGFTFIMKVGYTHGKYKGNKYTFSYKGEHYYAFAQLTKNNKPSTSMGKSWSLTVDRINELLKKGHITVIEFVEVTEYKEKTVYRKAARKQTVSNVPAIETTEVIKGNDEAVNVPAEVAVSYNEEKQGIEIRFPSKPESNIIEQLKANGFRWSKRGFWYAKQSEATIEFSKLIGSKATDEERHTTEPMTYDEIEINDLHLYTVSDELQSRLHSASMFEVNYKAECIDIFEEIQSSALDVVNSTDNKHVQHQIKKYLQSFKKRYYSQYIKILNHRANNPSWAVTGRGGLNVRRYNKMQDRYGSMLGQFSDMKKEFDNRMDKFKAKVEQIENNRIKNEVSSIEELPEFKVERKEITVAGYTETTRAYIYKKYMIAKSWGMFRVFKDGQEVNTNLKTTSRLDEAKRYVAYLDKKDSVHPEEVNKVEDDKKQILRKEEANNKDDRQHYISKINKQIESAQKKLNALSGDYQTNTWKRQQEAASREEKKDNLNLEIKILEHLKEKAISNTMDEFDIVLLVGSFREDMRIKYKSRGKNNYEVKYPTVNPDAGVNGWWNQEVPKLQKRLNKAGIHNTEQYNEAIDKYAALVKGIEKPVNPVQQKIRKMESEVKLYKIDGYFPTPKTIVQRMIDLADVQDGETILEPSAGNGNILDGVSEYIQDNSLNADLHCIEWNYTLRQILELKQYKLVANDFIEFVPFTKYHKIIMNPPFEKGKDVDHVLKAYDCLKDGGRLIAIMSPHWTFASDSKSIHFRNWLNNKGYYEKLPEGSFKESGTGVNTVLVVIEKSEEETARAN